MREKLHSKHGWHFKSAFGKEEATFQTLAESVSCGRDIMLQKL